jgi:4-amino-4-deoxychorismate lyase
MATAQFLINPHHIAATDRSAQYGDACFTSMYAESGAAFLLKAHLQRLQDGCAALQLPFTQWNALESNLREVLSGITDATAVKVLISRGSGGRGYQPPSSVDMVCVISTHPTDPILPPSVVLNLGVSDVSLSKEPWSGGIKHNNRLSQVLARANLQSKNTDELEDVLMCNEYQHVVEATSSNVFYQIDGVWHTPPIEAYGVKGVMREAWLQYLSQNDIMVNQSYHHIDMFREVEGMLLTNAVRGVRPVGKLTLPDSQHVLDTSAHLDLINRFMSQSQQAG